MNKEQKAALKIVADMIATEMFEIAVQDITDEDTKTEARNILQSYSEDGAYELIDSLNEKVETAMMKSFNKKAREHVAKIGRTYKKGVGFGI